MKASTPFESRTVVPFPVDNIDTDQIIPARFLKTIFESRAGRSAFLTTGGTTRQGKPNPDFVSEYVPNRQGAHDSGLAGR